ncbi:hypothetical protein CKO40_10535 [Halochromatium glycolicum]|uniref:Uncharacterized protein n=1 Tax=Halochromatium glycolicum TaxID=85075 RepID=A0AAJ0U458_9GAMM|nr:hypothetical protein [Halochromatium glycolicum]
MQHFRMPLRPGLTLRIAHCDQEAPRADLPLGVGQVVRHPGIGPPSPPVGAHVAGRHIVQQCLLQVFVLAKLRWNRIDLLSIRFGWLERQPMLCVEPITIALSFLAVIA